MPEQNQVSIAIPEDVLTEVKTAITTIQTKLEPYLVEDIHTFSPNYLRKWTD